MEQYDPLIEPDPEEWLALDEQERIQLVEDYHRRARVRLPRARRSLHAMMHAVVENQIAASEPVLVRYTVQRLIAEGLDRHDAVHAVASVMLGQMHSAMRDADTFSNERYADELNNLSAENWHRGNE
jgi:hypothetical protein